MICINLEFVLHLELLVCEGRLNPICEQWGICNLSRPLSAFRVLLRSVRQPLSQGLKDCNKL